MHEADDAYSIQSTWSCYWLDQFLTLALNTLILSIFYISVDLSTNYFAHFSGCGASFVCSCHSNLECCVMFSRVKLGIRSFVLFMQHGTSQVKQLQTCFRMTLFYALGFHQRSTMTMVVSLKMNTSIVLKNCPMSSTHEQYPTTHKVMGKLKDSTEPFYQCFAPYRKPTSLIGKTIFPS